MPGFLLYSDRAASYVEWMEYDERYTLLAGSQEHATVFSIEDALALIDELEPRMGRLLIRPDLAQREPEGRPDAPNPQAELVRAIPAQREG